MQGVYWDYNDTVVLTSEVGAKLRRQIDWVNIIVLTTADKLKITVNSSCSCAYIIAH